LVEQTSKVDYINAKMSINYVNQFLLRTFWNYALLTGLHMTGLYTEQNEASKI